MTVFSDTRAAVAPSRQVAGLPVSAWRRVGLGLALLLALVLPFWASSYHTFQLTLVVVYAIALMGLNLLTGYNGQISLGHCAFYAIGAYVTAGPVHNAGMPYWATVPGAGVRRPGVGFLVRLPAARAR